LAAAVPFYGQETKPDFTKTRAAVLAIYAQLDSRVNANRPTAETGLRKAGLTSESRSFPGVNNAFMNDTSASYDPTQAAAAYESMVDWFATYLR
jgi:carboxymethylenebutenolidase